MPWAIYDGENIIAIYDASALPFDPLLEEQPDNVEFLEDDDPDVVAFILATSGRPLVTFNQLLNRFTGPELSALSSAAQTDGQVLLWMTMGASTPLIDLSSSDVSDDMELLVTSEIITSERKIEILTP